MASQQSWALLSSEEQVTDKIKNHKDKLVVIIFNYSTVARFNVESKLKNKRQTYENSNVKFFKCNVIEISEPLPSALGVEDVPTFIFYRNGTKDSSLTNPTEQVLFGKLDELIQQQKQKSENKQ